jgi:hypothetical protein
VQTETFCTTASKGKLVFSKEDYDKLKFCAAMFLSIEDKNRSWEDSCQTANGCFPRWFPVDSLSEMNQTMSFQNGEETKRTVPRLGGTI